MKQVSRRAHPPIMRLGFAVFVLLPFLPPTLAAGEIATGSMLGPRFDEKSFYERSSPRGKWEQTYQVGAFRRQARGKLLGVRATYGLFDDQWLTGSDFDPAANTDALITALDRYQQYGVKVIAVSLQGGPAPYPDGGEHRRTGQASGGEKHGALVSAFAPDGSLDQQWMQRLSRLLQAASERQIAVSLTYFTPDQDEVFESPEAVVAAARNVTRWLIDSDARNVIIDLADSWDLESELWDFNRFIPRNIGSLVLDVRDQFNSAAFTLPIGATGGNHLTYPSSLARICDVILLRAGDHEADEPTGALNDLGEVERPVLLFAADPLAAAAADRAAGAVFAAPEHTGEFPFRYGADPEDADFLPLLERIAALALKKPPVFANEAR